MNERRGENRSSGLKVAICVQVNGASRAISTQLRPTFIKITEATAGNMFTETLRSSHKHTIPSLQRSLLLCFLFQHPSKHEQSFNVNLRQLYLSRYSSTKSKNHCLTLTSLQIQSLLTDNMTVCCHRS